ncbi:hypothetical protein B296_00041368, partial [Ensete ventricosum]
VSQCAGPSYLESTSTMDANTAAMEQSKCSRKLRCSIVKEDVGEETTTATRVTTRWVRLEATGRDEVAIGDDDTAAAEAVAALKKPWPEI